MVLFRKYILKIWLSLILKQFRQHLRSIILGIHGGLVQDPVMKVEGRTQEREIQSRCPPLSWKEGTRKYPQ